MVFPAFVTRCLDFNELLSKPDFDYMLQVAHNQSKRYKAKEETNYQQTLKYNSDEPGFIYFGMWFEWFVRYFLEYFPEFNVYDISMVDSIGCVIDDLGIDGMGKIRQDCKEYNVKANDPVYLQCKASIQEKTKYGINDKSRIINFAAAAAFDTVVNRHRAHYILITTGEATTDNFKKTTQYLVQEIHRAEIKTKVNDNIAFLNFLRQQVNLTEI